MNGREAIKIDTEFYAELDEETGDFCVFGGNSGFAYSSWSNEPMAKEDADRMNKLVAPTGIEPVSDRSRHCE